MTVGFGVIARKPRWKQCLPLEIPAAKLSCATSGSFRPRLGLAIFAAVVSCCAFALAYHYLLVVETSSAFPEEETAKSDEVDLRLNQGQIRENFVRAAFKSRMEKVAISVPESKAVEAVEAVAKADSVFGGKLYNNIVSGASDKNVILSSFSVEAVLTMVLSGARDKTAEQIRTGLALPGDDVALPGFAEIMKALAVGKSAEGFTLSAANRLFVQSGFELEDSFVETNKEVFLSEPEKVDYAHAAKAALAAINGWAEDQTMGKIKDLLSDDAVGSDTRLVLANAVYFKGAWLRKFDASKTEKMDFHLLGGLDSKKADMMKNLGPFEVDETSLKGARAIELPYKGERMSMVVVLPDEVDGLLEVEKAMVGFDLARGFNFVKSRGPVPLGLPRFRVETTHDLNSALQALGMTDMFNEKADFTGINRVSGKQLSVSSVIQKAFIEVNEEGSEAAAASGAVMMLRSMPPAPSRPFVCDRPFAFFIKDKLTGIVLFSGRIVDPTA